MNRIKYKEIPNYKNEYLKFLGLTIDPSDEKEIQAAKKGNRTKLEKKWEELKKQICENNCYPDTITKHPELYNLSLDEFLTADFTHLVKIYLDFISLIPSDDYQHIIHGQGKNGLKISKTELRIKDPLMEKANSTFTFTQTRSSSIANFFNYFSTRYNSSFQITTCFYCDTTLINSFKLENDTKRLYDIDHFIPKEQCPILALCLFNLVPSCKNCNSSTIKGYNPLLEFYNIHDKTYQQKYEILNKLSPTSDLYQYDETVKITVMPNTHNHSPWYPPIGYQKNPDYYKIDFLHSDKDYVRETEAFHYIERYNSTDNLLEALNFLDLRKRYTKTNISYIKDILCQNGETITEQDIYEDIFHTKFNKENGRIFSKLKKDILE